MMIYPTYPLLEIPQRLVHSQALASAQFAASLHCRYPGGCPHVFLLGAHTFLRGFLNTSIGLFESQIAAQTNGRAPPARASSWEKRRSELEVLAFELRQWLFAWVAY
jgi:hypothetical protein